MSFAIDGNTIILTRGDTARMTVEILDSEGQTYTPQEGDVVRFAVKRRYSDSTTVIKKTIPSNTLVLEIEPSDTEKLAFADYVYDIEITYANGDVDTFIAEQILRITPEVD